MQIFKNMMRLAIVGTFFACVSAYRSAKPKASATAGEEVKMPTFEEVWNHCVGQKDTEKFTNFKKYYEANPKAFTHIKENNQVDDNNEGDENNNQQEEGGSFAEVDQTPEGKANAKAQPVVENDKETEEDRKLKEERKKNAIQLVKDKKMPWEKYTEDDCLEVAKKIAGDDDGCSCCVIVLIIVGSIAVVAITLLLICMLCKKSDGDYSDTE